MAAQWEGEEKLPNVLKLQSILRAFLAVKSAEKRIKKHILRTKIANELLDTELHYYKDIRTIHWEFHLGSGEVLSLEEQAILFMNIGEIVSLHTELSKELQSRVRKNWSYHQTVGDLIEQYISQFSIYEKYITSYKEAADFLRKHRRQSPKLEKYLQLRESKEYCHGLTLESLLVMPVQRLPRYLLLLKELRKHTDSDHPDYGHINNALIRLDELAKRFNEVQRDKETQTKIAQIMAKVHGAEEVSLTKSFIKEGPISYKKIKIVKPGLVRSLSMGKNLITKEIWKELYVYLFKDTFLCAKKISAANTKTIMGAFYGKGLYKFSTTKSHALSATTHLEIVASDPCLFKLISDTEVSEFRVSSPHERDLWVLAFSSTLVHVVQDIPNASTTTVASTPPEPKSSV